jgi:hypothetical protein
MPSNDFYVYCHVKKTDGKCFYIGKGKNNRFKTTYSRNRYWKKVVDQHGFEPIILINGLSEQKAFELESIICEKVGHNNLVNIRKEEGWGGHSHQPETILKLSKPILQYSKSGNFLKKWDGATQASIFLSKHPSAITECCRGFRKTAYGFIWRHEDNPYKDKPKYIPKKDKPIKNLPYYHPIDQYDMNGIFIKTWHNTLTASVALQIPKSSISQCLSGKYKTSGGFKWIKSSNKEGGCFA